MSDEHEDYGPQLPSAHDLYRARERVLEVDQAGGSRAAVTQAQVSAERTEAAYVRAEDRRMEDPAYRAEVEASYDSDRSPTGRRAADDRLESTRPGREGIPAGEREEADLYADLGDSLQAWAHSWSSAAQAREADQAIRRQVG